MNRVLKSISILFKLTFLLLLMLSWLLFRKVAAATNLLNDTIVFSAAQLQAFKSFDNEQHTERSATQLTGRSFICLPSFRVFNLELPETGQQLAADETVAVSGDHYALGDWSIDKAVPLRAKNKQRNKWYLRRWICARHRVYYRYLIYALNGNGERVLRRWEGQQVPRMLQTFEIYRYPGVDIFGYAYPHSVGGGYWLERGWLQREYVIELKFIWQQHLEFLEGPSKVRLKLRSLSMVNDALIEVSRYGYNRSAFRQQSRQGVKYQDGAIVIFRISQSLDVENAFRLSIYELEVEQLPFAEVYILPEQLRGSRGILQLPVQDTSRRQFIGQLTLPYLVIRPTPNLGTASNLRVSFQSYWPNNWPTLDVGNRGLGSNNNQFMENTIESFLAVTKHKGDMVHLDVQLTRDYVPIIWRSFGFYTTSSHLPSNQPIVDYFDLRYVLIRELSYAELKASRVFIVKRWTVQELSHLNVRNVSQIQRVFPKLSEVYKALPKTLGLIVEIKWPQLMEAGILESTQTQTHNKNVFVDRILEVTAHFGCGRPLIFASYDADICTMVRLKQSAFPAIFMTTGRTNIWDTYMDLRAQTLMNAINFAENAEILGTAVHVQNFKTIKQQQLVNLGLDLHQVVFIWGIDLQDEQLLEQFRGNDVTGLIYDRMDLVGPTSWKRAPFFQAPQLMEVFGGQCVAIGNSTMVPGAKPTKPTVWPKMR